jgi:4-diphosphocytidyl-2C-methyl-D-erythritol kinase
MATVGLFDTLTITTSTVGAETGDGGGSAGSAAGPGPAVRLRCDPPGLPTDEQNLVYRALAGWAARVREAGGRFPPVDAVLAKRTPAGAGLGGGSSDAACAILAAARLTAGNRSGRGSSADDLSAFAARFGSDVPFFLHGPSAVCTGRGEVVRPIPPPAARWAVLVLPPVVMPTPDVYRRFDAMQLGTDLAMADEPDWAAWARLPAIDLLPRLANDLEPAAFELRPELDELRRAAERVVGQPVRMSGSGSSLFTLFDEQAAAADARERLRGRLAGGGGLADDAVVAVPVGVQIEVRDL